MLIFYGADKLEDSRSKLIYALGDILSFARIVMMLIIGLGAVVSFIAGLLSSDHPDRLTMFIPVISLISWTITIFTIAGVIGVTREVGKYLNGYVQRVKELYVEREHTEVDPEEQTLADEAYAEIRTLERRVSKADAC